MSWFVDDPQPRQAADRLGDHRAHVRKRTAKAVTMLHPDDLQKIAILLAAGCAGIACVFVTRLLAAGLGG